MELNPSTREKSSRLQTRLMDDSLWICLESTHKHNGPSVTSIVQGIGSYFLQDYIDSLNSTHNLTCLKLVWDSVIEY